MRLCDCHGEPMYHGHHGWQCVIKLRASKSRYNKTEKGRMAQARYREKNREAIRARASEWKRNKYASNPTFRLMENQASRRRAARARKETRLAEDQAA